MVIQLHSVGPLPPIKTTMNGTLSLGIYRHIFCCVLVLCSFSVFAQGEQIDAAIRFLAENKPFLYPHIELGRTDLEQRASAEKLIAAQLKALSQLKGCKETSAVSLLIPYLNYTTGVLPPSRLSLHVNPSLPPTNPTIQQLSENWPAFGIIFNIKGSDKVLVTYIDNRRIPIDYRLAAVVILRYMSEEEFGKCCGILSEEVKNAGPVAQAYLQAARAGKVAFDGIVPVIGVQ